MSKYVFCKSARVYADRLDTNELVVEYRISGKFRCSKKFVNVQCLRNFITLIFPAFQILWNLKILRLL